MRKVILILITLYGVAAMCVAGENGKIVGVLKGKMGKVPIEYATVALYGNNTQKLITGTMTDSVGYFHLDNVPADSDYYLVCSYVGYREVRSAVFTVSNKKKTD